MLKKLMLPILIVTILIQLLVPVWMIAYGNKAEEDLLKYGKEYKFRVRIYSIYKGSVDYSLYDMAILYQEVKYGVIGEDSEGYAIITETRATRPEDTNYIRMSKETRINLTEFSVMTGQNYISVQEQSAYLLVKIYKGNFEIVDLYIDGIPAQEWVTQNEPETEKREENLFS
ncbi:MAG: hypothetical protein IKV25_07780 [Clostridia bacterium]|nr:hypothetical protein [Clostridia bacterium]